MVASLAGQNAFRAELTCKSALRQADLRHHLADAISSGRYRTGRNVQFNARCARIRA
jgi:hypothetical protein